AVVPSRVQLAGELDAGWNYRSKELMTLYSKAKAYEAGEKVTLGDKEFAPLYTPKNDTLINLFQITSDEQAQLRTIIGADMARERDRKRHEAKRRAAGAVDRETYLDAAQAKRKQAQALKAEGLSVRVIAQRMGVSVGAIAGYLKAPQERSRSVRITADQSSIGAGITADSAQHDVQSPSVLLMAKPCGRDLRA
ncbi:replication protein, partial [Xanthomonas euvesicatoria]